MPWHGPPGWRLYYEDSGRGDAVVLMPGWGGSIADLGRLRRDLADGFRVVAALLVAGTYDKFCSPGKTRELAEAIPRGQFAEAHGAGHEIHISHPGWLSATALRWLAGH
jgi:valacyclovir hydrolase